MITKEQESKPVRLSQVHARKRINARFDVAQTTTKNARHWSAADGMSADAAYSPNVRKIIRERARLEMENNCYCKAVVWIKVNDVIGAGPRLQLLPDDSDPELEKMAEKVERQWSSWVTRICLHEKMRTAYAADISDGEGLGTFITNRALPGLVKLDLRLIECDRLSAPLKSDYTGENLTDGLHFDQWGNVEAYDILRDHPGDLRSMSLEADKIPAKYVFHIFKQLRAEQHRGVSALAPALPLFADIRRFTAATVQGAETAADFAMIIHTNGPAHDPDDDEETEEGFATMDSIPLEKGLATTMPKGWDVKQMKPEQPTTGYGDFKYQIISEVGRCVNMPYIIAAGDSSKSNFASAKLDGRSYERELHIEQSRMERPYDQGLGLFLEELSGKPGYERAEELFGLHHWMWEGQPEVDPKDADANQTKLESGELTYSELCSKQGRDYKAKLKQRGREKRMMMAEGIYKEPKPAKETSKKGSDDASSDDNTDD